MKQPTDRITHDDESFLISYTEWFTCDSCGLSWEDTTADDPDQDYRTEPKGNASCPECGNTTGNSYTKQAHYYMKFIGISQENPPLEVEPHVKAIRQTADEFEALEANGWDITESDGVHIYFEKTEIESLNSDYEISDDLQ